MPAVAGKVTRDCGLQPPPASSLQAIGHKAPHTPEYTDSTVLKLPWPGHAPQVSMVAVPLHVGVQVYQTSGEPTEKPHGVGMEPAADGVAHIVVPQMFVPICTAMALPQRSLGGGLVGALMFKRNWPAAPATPETRKRYGVPAMP